jgi:hypothetical protein
MDTEVLHEVPSHSNHSSVVRPLPADVQMDRRWRQLCHDAVQMSPLSLSLSLSHSPALFPPDTNDRSSPSPYVNMIRSSIGPLGN